MSLAQIGEFSFIIAALGLTLKVTSDFLYPIGVTVSALTTLLTPYLIRGSDGLVAFFDRTAPRSWLRVLDRYTHRVNTLKNTSSNSLESILIGKLSWQLGINMFLLSGIFVTAALLGGVDERFIRRFIHDPARVDAITWAVAVTLSLPLLFATFVKLQSLGVLVAESTLGNLESTDRNRFRRRLLTYGIPTVGMAFSLGLVLTLSSNIMPPPRISLPLLGVAALVSLILWKFLIKVYSKAQRSLESTLDKKQSELADSQPH
jgi:CPA2 family monovalent cation:H+ antiporter-2